MKFYLFNQNNSGGFFKSDKNITNNVAIEAESLAKAEAFAFSIGIYYNGCEDGIDCECCGDRWYKPSELEFPHSYSKSNTFADIESYLQYQADNYGWLVPDGRIFYNDGTIKEIFSKNDSEAE